MNAAPQHIGDMSVSSAVVDSGLASSDACTIARLRHPLEMRW